MNKKNWYAVQFFMSFVIFLKNEVFSWIGYLSNFFFISAVERVSSGIVQINAKEIQTNIILLKIVKDGMKASDLIARLHWVFRKNISFQLLVHYQ